METCVCLYLAQFFLKWEILQIKVLEKSKDILHSITFSPEVVPFFEEMWKNIVDPGRPRMAI
jgi:hypothetical protein